MVYVYIFLNELFHIYMFLRFYVPFTRAYNEFVRHTPCATRELCYL